MLIAEVNHGAILTLQIWNGAPAISLPSKDRKVKIDTAIKNFISKIEIYVKNNYIILNVHTLKLILEDISDNDINSFGLPAIISRTMELFENYNFEGIAIFIPMNSLIPFK